jgi:hypothetical protein
MSFVVRRRPLWLLLFVLLGCDGGPSGPSTGSLRVTVLGLPSGSAAAITVTGPDGFSQPASSTTTFTQLTPGIYTVAASSVTVGGTEYAPSPPNQTVGVTAGDGQASATVFYSQATGNLTLTISGLGSGSTAAVTVTGPGYTQDVPATTTLMGLDPGSYTVSARDTVANGGTPHTASPTSQTVTISAHATVSTNVTYTPPPANGSVNLQIAGMYLTQSAQTYGGTVPLVQGRDGYLRIFVVADRSNTAAPAVKVRFFNGLVPVDSATIVSPGLTVPTAVDESSLGYSWNVPVTGTLIQTNLRIQAEVDPAGAVLETQEGDNLYPAATPLVMDVRIVPTVDVTFVPVLQRGIPLNRRRGNVSDANKAQFLQTTQRMHPIFGFNALVHQDYTTTTTDTLHSQNANGAWGTILGEIDALRIAEHSPRYYYGVARVSYSSGVAGVAYVSNSSIGGRAALGWDYLPSGSLVAAHELGHNWARNHAPCGGPAGVDPQYPQADGSTGSYGLDVATQTLEPPTLGDIMGYCDPKWIGEYTYRGVLNYLLAPSPPILSTPASQTIQPTLLVWGQIRNGEPVLEPAFQLKTRPSLPERPGPYTISGQAEDGSTLFALSFAPREVADAVQDQQTFAFAVPLSSARAARLASIHLVGRGRRTVRSGTAPLGVQPGAGGQSDGIEARRGQGGGVALRWNSQAHPMVMVRDPDTGEVLSFARGGEVELPTSKGRIDLLVSNGVRSRAVRTPVAP